MTWQRYVGSPKYQPEERCVALSFAVMQVFNAVQLL